MDDDNTSASDEINTEGVAAATPSFFSWRLRLNGVFATLAAAACLPTWLSFGARLAWLPELATSFVGWYAASLPVFLVGVLALRRWRLSLFVLATLGVNLSQLALYAPNRGPDLAAEGTPKLRVMSLNVLTKNRQFDRVLSLIETENPDVVVLLEVDDRWTIAVASLKSRYPHGGHRVRSDNFGVALYSRLPLDSVAFGELTPTGTPTAVAKLDWNGAPLTILGAHPLTPMSPSGLADRNADLAAFASLASRQAGEVLLMGDLNITPFSPYFQDLLKDGNLNDSAWGRGCTSTWGPRGLGPVIPIDHVLHSDGLRVLDRRIGPAVGSDHRALVVDFAPKAENR